MTQALTPSNDLGPVTLCDSCAGTQRNWRKASGHLKLTQSTNRSETRKHGQVTITKYRCEPYCTPWVYENNTVNRSAAWSVGEE